MKWHDRPVAGRRRGIPRGYVGVALLVLAGCGGGATAPVAVQVYPVHGTVLRADGKPVSGGRIYFVPKDGLVTPDGPIGPDGAFALSTSSSGAGAPAGAYKIRIEPDDPTLMSGKRPARAGKRLPFPARYLDEDSSGLTVAVKAEPNRLDPIRLK